MKLCRLDESDQLDDRHLSVVTTTRHRPRDPGVTAVAVPIAGWRFVKERVDQLLVVDVAQHSTPRGETAVLGQRDHPFGFIAQCFGSRLCCRHPAFADELCCESAKQRLALVSRAAQQGNSTLVAHGCKRKLKEVGIRRWCDFVGSKCRCVRELRSLHQLTSSQSF